MSSMVAEVVAKFTANTVDLNRGIAETKAKTAELNTGMSGMAKVGAAAWAGLGLAAVASAGLAVEAASTYEQAHAQLITAMKNSGTATAANRDEVEKLDAKMRQLGFTDSQTESALSRSLVATKNMATSEKDLAVAADLAAARHMDLNSALQLVTRAQNGTYTALLRLGLVSKAQAASFESGAQAVDFLAQKFQGQASAAADTFAGRIKVLKAELDRIAVQVGEVLIPAIEGMAGAVAGSIDWFEKHKAVAIALAAVVGGPLVYAMLAFAAAQAIAAGTAILDFWSNVPRLVGNFAAMLSNATAAVVEFGVAEAAVTAGAAVAGFAALAAVGYGLYTAFTNASPPIKIASADLNIFSETVIGKSLVKLDQFGKQWGDTTAANRAFNEALKQSPAAAQRFIESADQAGFYTGQWQGKLASHIRTMYDAALKQQAYNEVVDRGTTAIDANTVATQANVDAANKLIQAQLTAIGSDLAVQHAQNDLTTAQQHATDGSETASQAVLDLADKQLALVTALESSADAHRKAGQSADDQVNQLLQLEGTLQPGSALQQAIDAYIQKLNSIPKNVSTTLELFGHTTNIPNSGAGVFQMSAGGFVPGAGNSDSVPTMLTPGEFVVSKDMQRRGQFGPLGHMPAAPMTSAGGGGTVNNYFTVNAGMGADGQQIARVLAEEFKLLQSRGGPVPWVKA